MGKLLSVLDTRFGAGACGLRVDGRCRAERRRRPAARAGPGRQRRRPRRCRRSVPMARCRARPTRRSRCSPRHAGRQRRQGQRHHRRTGALPNSAGRDLSGGLTIEKLLGRWTVVSGADQCPINLTQTQRARPAATARRRRPARSGPRRRRQLAAHRRAGPALRRARRCIGDADPVRQPLHRHAVGRAGHLDGGLRPAGPSSLHRCHSRRKPGIPFHSLRSDRAKLDSGFRAE